MTNSGTMTKCQLISQPWKGNFVAFLCVSQIRLQDNKERQLAKLSSSFNLYIDQKADK